MAQGLRDTVHLGAGRSWQQEMLKQLVANSHGQEAEKSSARFLLVLAILDSNLWDGAARIGYVFSHQSTQLRKSLTDRPRDFVFMVSLDPNKLSIKIDHPSVFLYML